MKLIYIGGQHDWLNLPVLHAVLKLNQPSSVPVLLSCFFFSLSCFSRACSSAMKPVTSVCLQKAKFVTFDFLFQSRDQDNDPSKHPWAKPGSVNTFWCVCVCVWMRIRLPDTVFAPGLSLFKYWSVNWGVCLSVYTGETRPLVLTACQTFARGGPFPLLVNWWVCITQYLPPD